MSKDVEFFENETGIPPYKPERKPRGCVFYGCLAAIVVSILAAVLLGIFFFTILKMFTKFVEEYGEDAPRPIATAELPADELKALTDRFKSFETNLLADKPTEPIVFTAKEINAYINSDPDMKGVFSVNFVGDKIEGEVAFPLERLGYPGKFINGKALFDVRVSNGKLLVTIDELEVKGKKLSDEVMAQIRLQNLTKDMNEKQENIEYFSRIESIEVKDGKLMIKPKPRPDAAKGEPNKPEEKKVEPKKEAEPANKAA